MDRGRTAISTSRPPMPDEPLHILLVEDNPGDARLVEIHLADAAASGTRVTRVETLAAARFALDAGGVDLVLLDLCLPDSCGLDTLDAVVWCEAPVVVLSGHVDEETALEAVRRGAEESLRKADLHPGALLPLLLHAVERRRQRRRLLREAERTGRLERVASALAVALTSEQVADVMMREGLEAAGASAGALFVLAPGGGELHLHAQQGLSPEELGALARVPLDSPGLLTRAVQTGEPVFPPEPAGPHEQGPSLPGGRTAAVPLAGERGPVGALLLGFPDGDAALEQDLTPCTVRCGAALERALRYEREQEARAEAQAATRLRDEVLGVVAHDLRGPLSAIIAYASLLQDDTPGVEAHQYGSSILRLAQQMDTLIQDLLTVSRLEAGQLSLEPRPVTPESLLHEAVQLLESVAERKEVRLHANPTAGLLRVMADRDRVMQVLSNLVGNAVKFTPAGGSVEVRAEALGGEVLFLVADTGPGIPPEDVPHVFERFWQPRTRGGGGTGLGLAIARGFVERHGGRIGVDSRPGVGSTFFFTLPTAVASPAPPPVAPAAPPVQAAAPPDAASGPPRGGRVLLVDDHPLLRRALRYHLAREPRFEVVGEAGSGEEAVRMAELLRPDVVVMDLNLPGIDGNEATRAILAGPNPPRVLALSAEREEPVVLKVLESGASGFVHKATAHEELCAALDTVLDGRVYLHPSGSAILLRELVHPADEPSPELPAALSDSERQVIRLCAEGYTSAEIGRKLFLSPRTVDTYRSRAMRRLGLHSRAELVRFAVRHGMIGPC